MVEPHVPRGYNICDTFAFVHDVNQLPTSGKFMVSFDVEILFTSIPLDECIDSAVTYIYQGNPGLTISPTDLKTLFSFSTAGTHFLFKGVFHDQVDGVAMGSPLAPVLANLFMGHHEKNWLDNFSSSKFCSMDAMLMTLFACSITKMMRSCSLITSTQGTQVSVSQWKGKSIRNYLF